jgi:hypothetical protein
MSCMVWAVLTHGQGNLSRIWTHDPSVWVGEDGSRLRPLCHCDRWTSCIWNINVNHSSVTFSDYGIVVCTIKGKWCSCVEWHWDSTSVYLVWVGSSAGTGSEYTILEPESLFILLATATKFPSCCSSLSAVFTMKSMKSPCVLSLTHWCHSTTYLCNWDNLGSKEILDAIEAGPLTNPHFLSFFQFRHSFMKV